MPRRSRRRRSRRGRSSVPSRSIQLLSDYTGGKLIITSFSDVPWSQMEFGAYLVDRPFRLSHVIVQLVAQTDAVPFQISIYQPPGYENTAQKSQFVATTGPRLAGPLPIRVRVNNAGNIWSPAGTATTNIFRISTMCQSKEDTGYLRWVAQVFVLVKPEIWGLTCPKLDMPSQFSDGDLDPSLPSSSFDRLTLSDVTEV